MWLGITELNAQHTLAAGNRQVDDVLGASLTQGVAPFRGQAGAAQGLVDPIHKLHALGKEVIDLGGSL